MRLNEKIRRLLDDRGLSYRGAAKKLKVSPTTVNNWVRAVKPVLPRLDEAVRIATFFDVPLEYLANDAHEDPAVLIEERDIVRLAYDVGGFDEARRRMLIVRRGEEGYVLERPNHRTKPAVDTDGPIDRPNSGPQRRREG